MYYPAVRTVIFLSPSAIAAPPLTGEFPVAAAQMQALGVTLVPLEKPAAIDGQAYPAHVVLPPGGEQLVSAPFFGLVVELLVEEQQPVKDRRIVAPSGPEFGDLQLKLIEAASKAKLGRKSLGRERQLFAEGIIPSGACKKRRPPTRRPLHCKIYAESSLRLAKSRSRNRSHGPGRCVMSSSTQCWALLFISGVSMPNSFTRRTQLRLACGLFALTALAATSAPIANEFAVTPAQLQALGVQLQKLDKPAPINGLAFRACGFAT